MQFIKSCLVAGVAAAAAIKPACSGATATVTVTVTAIPGSETMTTHHSGEHKTTLTSVLSVPKKTLTSVATVPHATTSSHWGEHHTSMVVGTSTATGMMPQSTCMNADTVVNAINAVTTLSGNLDKTTNNINSPFDIPGTGPQVVAGFGTIGKTVLADIANMKKNPMCMDSPNQQQDICDAFHGFVKVHQDLLMTVIGKKAYFSEVGFTAPMAAALRGIEGGVDTLADGIIGSVPGCSGMAKADKASLDKTLMEAVSAYS